MAKDIDLRKELPVIREYIRRRVAQHNINRARQAVGPVRRIEFGYEMGQGNHLLLYIDTRPNADSDGEWSLAFDDPEVEVLHRPDWPVWHELPEDARANLYDLHGKAVDAASDEAIQRVGEFLRDSLIAARDDGDFESLSKADGCSMWVEHLEGYFFWPTCDERETVNNKI